jgi:hypothetical protein
MPYFEIKQDQTRIHFIDRAMDGPKAAKYVGATSVIPEKLVSSKFERKRKLADKTIPNVILQNPDFAEDSKMYQDLLEMERRLDWTMMRKKVEVQDALTRNPTVSCFMVLSFVDACLMNWSRQRGRCEYFSATQCQDNSGRLAEM